MDMNLSKLWKIVEDRGTWCATVHGVADSWTIKKADHRGIDAFAMLRIPWIRKRSYQSILKEINPEYSWEGLILS